MALCYILPFKLTFNYLPVEKPLDNEDPASFAERVRVEIGRRTGLALSKLTFENGLINEECKRLGLPRETIEENAEKLMKACEMKVKDVFHRLQEFKDLRDAEENLITFESANRAVRGETPSEKQYLERKGITDSSYLLKYNS